MGVIFDLDGTLIDSLSLHARLLKKGLDSVLGQDIVEYNTVEKFICYPTSFFFRILRTKYGIDISSKKTAEIMQIKDDAFRRRDIEKVKVFPYVRDTFKFLKSKNVKLCIATSMNTRALKKFSPILKLRSLSKVIINSPSFFYEKPNPYILNKAIRELKMDRAKTAYVGDSPADREAASNAGISFIGVFNSALAGHGRFFEDFNGLLSYLRETYKDFLD
ncbi:HAD family hydrolase [Candidatus Parvarchaeota archaeon]|nr:HAD family hydrolase [Candidatus Parvarchaeota archaeon]